MYLLATQHLNAGATADANDLLIRIRRIERVWTLGNSAWLRSAVILKGIGIAVLVAAIMRSFPLPGLSDRQPPLQRFAEDLFSFVTFVFVGPPLAHALIAATLSDWHELDLIKDSGDRLEKILRADNTVATSATKPSRRKTLDGLSHRQVLGVGCSFTKAQLKSARNRMAHQFHPDRSASSRPEFQAANNEAMKRVNAAYDALSAEL